jgi:hypothetical protein
MAARSPRWVSECCRNRTGGQPASPTSEVTTSGIAPARLAARRSWRWRTSWPARQRRLWEDLLSGATRSSDSHRRGSRRGGRRTGTEARSTHARASDDARLRRGPSYLRDIRGSDVVDRRPLPRHSKIIVEVETDVGLNGLGEAPSTDVLRTIKAMVSASPARIRATSRPARVTASCPGRSSRTRTMPRSYLACLGAKARSDLHAALQTSSGQEQQHLIAPRLGRDRCHGGPHGHLPSWGSSRTVPHAPRLPSSPPLLSTSRKPALRHAWAAGCPATQ